MAQEPREVTAINEKLNGPFKLAVVSIDECELLEKNARFMKHETFRNLVENVKRDGGLSSVPFCVLTKDGKYKVLSGNHRVMAAREAGLKEIPIMYTDRSLTRDEEIAIQLSHNALVGEDDPVILRELYNEIEDLSLKYYSGLDDKVLEQLEKVSVPGLTEAHIDFLSISFLFLPDELDRLRDVLERAKGEITSDTFLARMAEYDRTLDALSKAKASYNVINSATAMMLVLDVFERHIEDLRAGWLDSDGETVLHKGWVPLASILGTDMVPASAAAVIHQAVETMLSRGEVTTKNKWQALEYMAAEYLSGGEGV
ncbi:MAG: ParB/RepB/Spo0J family partition protein [Alicyclobacillus sp.]|nr:ParB/RepB/Spo0J family partition protein [Alicyclobacillus sp.]